jgi:L-cysteine:1D-myo-inositol 2-amino-2-deoxy-alpha-D-glucopyranoside ligase
VFVSRLRQQGVPPARVRLALLAHRYRDDWEWSPQDLVEAGRRLDLWEDAAGRPSGPPADGLLDDVRSCLADDLDAPSALALVDQWAQRCVRAGGRDPDAPALVRRLVDTLLGVALTAPDGAGAGSARTPRR